MTAAELRNHLPSRAPAPTQGAMTAQADSEIRMDMHVAVGLTAAAGQICATIKVSFCAALRGRPTESEDGASHMNSSSNDMHVYAPQKHVYHI